MYITNMCKIHPLIYKIPDTRFTNIPNMEPTTIKLYMAISIPSIMSYCYCLSCIAAIYPSWNLIIFIWCVLATAMICIWKVFNDVWCEWRYRHDNHDSIMGVWQTHISTKNGISQPWQHHWSILSSASSPIAVWRGFVPRRATELGFPASGTQGTAEGDKLAGHWHRIHDVLEGVTMAEGMTMVDAYKGYFMADTNYGCRML